MSKMEIYLLDKDNNAKEVISIEKPNTYQELLSKLKQKFKSISENYEIYILDNKNQAVIINNEEKYKKIEDILYIHEIDKDTLEQSIFQINYNKLSESKQEILDDKYNCILCSILIKNEQPYFCYKCQKIFHEECIKGWDQKCKEKKIVLTCPNCRYELPLEKWNKKLNYEDNRIDNGNLMNKMNQYKLNNNMFNSISIIKDKKINELKKSESRHANLINKYENYIEITIGLFKNILNQINSIHSLLELKNNFKLDNLIKKYPLNSDNLELKDISNIINDEFEQFENHLKANTKTDDPDNSYLNQLYIKNNQESIIFNNVNESTYNYAKKNNNNNNSKIMVQNYVDEGNINKKENLLNLFYIDDSEQIKLDEKEMNLVYFAKFKDEYNIFGEQFVENNKDNIELIINGEKSKLINNYKLKKGNNIIKMVIKKNNKLINLSNMFNWCESLKDIRGLKNLDVKFAKDLSYMFYGCSLLSDIKPLENWNVSNCNDFSGMFCGCSNLTDIKPLQNWNVSNGNYFSYMFSGCSSLSDIKPLQNWNVKNGNDFSFFFSECISLSNINDLQKWNVSNGNNFYHMFSGCSSLSDISTLKSWNVSKEELSF